MPIKQRKVIPNPVTQASEEALGETPERAGRNQALQGLRLEVYSYIEINPGCTRRQVAAGLRLSSSTATARIKELIDEGLVYEPPEKKRNTSGVIAHTLKVAPENYVGAMRDRVRVSIHIMVDVDGNYYAKSTVVGGRNATENNILCVTILTKEITIMVPKAKEFNSLNNTDQVSKVTRGELHSSNKLTIDADFYQVSKDV